MNVVHSLPPGLRKLALYIACGGSGVALDFAVYSLLVLGGCWYQLANFVGYALGTCLSFFLNRAITFGVRDAPVRRFLSFIVVASIGYLASMGLLWTMVDTLHVDPVISKILTLFAVLAIQFSLNLLVTFRSTASQPFSKRAKR